jgi:hypothetical protein
MDYVNELANELNAHWEAWSFFDSHAHGRTHDNHTVSRFFLAYQQQNMVMSFDCIAYHETVQRFGHLAEFSEFFQQWGNEVESVRDPVIVRRMYDNLRAFEESEEKRSSKAPAGVSWSRTLAGFCLVVLTIVRDWRSLFNLGLILGPLVACWASLSPSSPPSVTALSTYGTRVTWAGVHVCCLLDACVVVGARLLAN